MIKIVIFLLCGKSSKNFYLDLWVVGYGLRNTINDFETLSRLWGVKLISQQFSIKIQRGSKFWSINFPLRSRGKSDDDFPDKLLSSSSSSDSSSS